MKRSKLYTDTLNELMFEDDIEGINGASVSPINIITFARKSQDFCFKEVNQLSKSVYKAMFLFAKKETVILYSKKDNCILEDNKVILAAQSFLRKVKSTIKIIIPECEDIQNIKDTNFIKGLNEVEKELKNQYLFQLLSIINIVPKKKVTLELKDVSGNSVDSFIICDDRMYRENSLTHENKSFINFNDKERCTQLKRV